MANNWKTLNCKQRLLLRRTAVQLFCTRANLMVVVLVQATMHYDRSFFLIAVRFDDQSCQLRLVRFPVTFQQQRRSDHRNGGSGHRSRRHPWLEEDAERYEEAGRQRYADDVIDAGEQKIVSYALHRFSREFDRRNDVH